MAIKHLVLSGGGPAGLTTYGILKYLNKNKYWDINNIKTIYGTSVGSLIGVLLILNLHWKEIDNFFIKKEWDKILNFNSQNILDLYTDKGLLDESFIINILTPLLKKKNIPENITLLDFYNLTKIALHIFTVNLNDENIKSIDLSYETFPNLPLLKAITMSSAVPLIFKPIFFEGGCYIDGGLLNNFPIKNCLDDNKCDHKEILLIQKNVKNKKNEIMVEKESTIFEYMNIFIQKIHKLIDSDIDVNVENKIVIDKDIIKSNNIFEVYETLEDQSIRENLINYGEDLAKEFLKKNKNL